MSVAEIERSDLATLDLDDVIAALDSLGPAEALLGASRCVFVWDARAVDANWGEFMVGLGAADSAAPTEDGVAALLDRWGGAPRVVGARTFEGASAHGSVDPGLFVLPRVLLRATPRGVEMSVARPLDDAAARETEALVAWVRGFAPRSRRGDAPRPRLDVQSDGLGPFAAAVEHALSRIADGTLEKVVVRRTVTMRGRVSVSDVLARLARMPHTTRFAFARDGVWFVGATPELLVSKRGSDVETEAVAGSLKRSPGAEVTAELRALVESPKDRWEHELVGREIERTLGNVGVRMDIREAPRTRTLAHLHHLVTPMRGRAMKPMGALALALALHPTPAMGGVPRDRALTFIREHEAPRGLYASPIGWLDASGDGTFVVGIRSALVEPASVTLFAGVGIVKGSTLDAEIAETEAKLEGVRRSLGLEASDARPAEPISMEVGA